MADMWIYLVGVYTTSCISQNPEMIYKQINQKSVKRLGVSADVNERSMTYPHSPSFSLK